MVRRARGKRSPSHGISRRPSGIRAGIDDPVLAMMTNETYPAGSPQAMRPHVDPMPELGKRSCRRGRKSAFQAKEPRITRMRRERVRMAIGDETRLLDRSLRIHSKDRNIQEDLQDGLHLAIASRRS